MDDPKPTPSNSKRGGEPNYMAARTPNDYNRGVQNATEAGVADNRRVLEELEEARAVQRRELAEILMREFSQLIPSFRQQQERGRTDDNGDFFEQIVQRVRDAVEEQRLEIRELRETIAEYNDRQEQQQQQQRPTSRRDEHQQQEDKRLTAQMTRELEALREQTAQDEEMIRYLQECRLREAQVIADWKKDILLWLKRYQPAPQHQQYNASAYDPPPPALRRRRQHSSQHQHHRHGRRASAADVDDDYYDESPLDEDYEELTARLQPPARTTRHAPSSSARQWRQNEERLIDILEQGERMYEKILETSNVIKKRLAES